MLGLKHDHESSVSVFPSKLEEQSAVNESEATPLRARVQQARGLVIPRQISVNYIWMENN